MIHRTPVRGRQLLRSALGLIAAAVPFGAAQTAHPAEFFLSDFTSAAETDLGVTSAWQYNNTDKAPWTAGWDNDSSLTFDFGPPIAPGENHRLRAPLTAPTPTFTDFPYTKVKVTFSGIPVGETVLFQIRQELSSGYIKRTWPVGNGTHELTLDGTDIPSFDGGSNTPFNPAASNYNRIRLQIDLTTLTNWPTDYANVDASIDYVVITDDPDYGVIPEGEGEGTTEGSTEGAVEGEGEDLVYSYTAEVGDDISFTVPNPGTAGPGDFSWTFAPQSGGSPQPLSETSGTLALTGVIVGDSGSYVATYDNGAKAVTTFTANLNVVSSLPALSSLSLTMLATALSAAGLVSVRGRRRP